MDFEDVSSNNPPPDLDRMAAAGIDLIAIKASGNPAGYAWDYVWAEGSALADAARERSLDVIRYHFAHPGVSGKAQAQLFLAHTNPADTPCLDLEGGGWARGEANDVAHEFGTEVALHRDPGILYGGYPNFAANGVSLPPGLPRTWIAAYPTIGATPAGWPAPWAHQFTDHGMLPGMAAPGDVSHLLGKGLAPNHGQPKPPTPSHHCDGDSQVWWDGHGCIDTHSPNLPHDARGVSRDGELLGYVTKGMDPLGWHSLYSIPSTATVTGFTWTSKGWRQS